MILKIMTDGYKLLRERSFSVRSSSLPRWSFLLNRQRACLTDSGFIIIKRPICLSSPNGWYDMRFTLTDEAGNKMVQTLSPAFCIKGQTGITAVDAERMEIEIVGNEIIVANENVGGITVYSTDGRVITSGKGAKISLGDIQGLVIVKVTANNGSSRMFKTMVK